jgi:hypothetical protein
MAQNYQGLGLASAVGELRDLVWSLNPTVVFLSKTKLNSKAIDQLKWSMGFTHGVAVNSKEKSGGLALLWKDRVEVSVQPWCQYYIDAKIKWGDFEWRFTGIYGEPRKELCQKTWDVMRYLRGQDNLPWLCAGDFNEIIRLDEQVGGNQRSAAQMERFRDCLANYGLADLGLSGYKFTGTIGEMDKTMCRPVLTVLRVTLVSPSCSR